ncbi:MAG TPA: nucleotide exchange factor GrpE [Desulfarculaceae bacterium]|nr:nucleotide exchange factor GrpE [Desulfarculaceae bacterium]
MELKKAKNKIDSSEPAATEEVTTATEDQVDADAPVDETEELKVEVENLRQLNASLKEQMLRIQAEAENFRKRMQREKDEFARFAREGFVRDLLPVKDNLERALLHAADDPQAIVAGVELILEQFDSTFKTMGVECVECQGKVFDPEVHEAMSQVESDEHEPNAVVDELQKGYQLHGRLVRPAMVTIAKARTQENKSKG